RAAEPAQGFPQDPRRAQSGQARQADARSVELRELEHDGERLDRGAGHLHRARRHVVARPSTEDGRDGRLTARPDHVAMSTDASFRSKYGPNALVAGAAVGLGAEYSRQIAARGLGLVMIDRDAGALAKTADTIRKDHGVDVKTLEVDLGRADIADRVRAGLGGTEIGLLVYNAALGTVAPFLETTPALADAVVDVTCRGPVRLVPELGPALVARDRGGVVRVS